MIRGWLRDYWNASPTIKNAHFALTDPGVFKDVSRLGAFGTATVLGSHEYAFASYGRAARAVSTAPAAHRFTAPAAFNNDITADWHIECLVKLDLPTKQVQQYLWAFHGTTSSNAAISLVVGSSSTGSQPISVYGAAVGNVPTTFVSTVSTIDLYDGKWHLLSVSKYGTVDGSVTWQIHVDGVLVGQTTTGRQLLNQTIDYFYVGSDGGGSQSVRGWVGEARYHYNSARLGSAWPAGTAPQVLDPGETPRPRIWLPTTIVAGANDRIPIRNETDNVTAVATVAAGTYYDQRAFERAVIAAFDAAIGVGFGGSDYGTLAGFDHSTGRFGYWLSMKSPPSADTIRIWWMQSSAAASTALARLLGYHQVPWDDPGFVGTIGTFPTGQDPAYAPFQSTMLWTAPRAALSDSKDVERATRLATRSLDGHVNVLDYGSTFDRRIEFAGLPADRVWIQEGDSAQSNGALQRIFRERPSRLLYYPSHCTDEGAAEYVIDWSQDFAPRRGRHPKRWDVGFTLRRYVP